MSVSICSSIDFCVCEYVDVEFLFLLKETSDIFNITFSKGFLLLPARIFYLKYQVLLICKASGFNSAEFFTCTVFLLIIGYNNSFLDFQFLEHIKYSIFLAKENIEAKVKANHFLH